MNQQRDIPGMTQLVAWLTRPTAAQPPAEVTRMLTNITHVEMLRISEKAAARARVMPATAYERIRAVWEQYTPTAEEPTPPPAAAAQARDATPLLQFVFDRYWYYLNLVATESGEGIHDDDQRAVQIMRVLGWKPPELRDPVVLPGEGTT